MLVGCTPKVTEKTTHGEGLDFPTSRIHSMRVYGRGWEIRLRRAILQGHWKAQGLALVTG